jgi:hypothetical protein
VKSPTDRIRFAIPLDKPDPIQFREVIVVEDDLDVLVVTGSNEIANLEFRFRAVPGE